MFLWHLDGAVHWPVGFRAVVRRRSFEQIADRPARLHTNMLRRVSLFLHLRSLWNIQFHCLIEEQCAFGPSGTRLHSSFLYWL